jgi:hypothetical protein
MMVEAEGQAEQARAFLGHNRDRVNITTSQMFFAALSAGDEVALDTRNVCARAGATILRNPRPGREYRAGEVAAISTLVSIVKRRGVRVARRVMEICVKTEQAPASAEIMKAVEHLLASPDFAAALTDDEVIAAIQKCEMMLDVRVTEIALAKRLPRWKAAAIVIFQHSRKRGRPAGQLVAAEA